MELLERRNGWNANCENCHKAVDAVVVIDCERIDGSDGCCLCLKCAIEAVCLLQKTIPGVYTREVEASELTGDVASIPTAGTISNWPQLGGLTFVPCTGPLQVSEHSLSWLQSKIDEMMKAHAEGKIVNIVVGGDVVSVIYPESKKTTPHHETVPPWEEINATIKAIGANTPCVNPGDYDVLHTDSDAELEIFLNGQWKPYAKANGAKIFRYIPCRYKQ